MNLVERLDKIRTFEGFIKESDLDQLRIQQFLTDHRRHNGYKITLSYREDSLTKITIGCSPEGLETELDGEECNSKTLGSEVNPIQVYFSEETKTRRLGLIERLKLIAQIDKLSETDLELEEANFFWDEHQLHGGYQIEILADSKGLVELIVGCCAYDLPDITDCTHYNPFISPDLRYSLIYCSFPVEEIQTQKERRQTRNN